MNTTAQKNRYIIAFDHIPSQALMLLQMHQDPQFSNQKEVHIFKEGLCGSHRETLSIVVFIILNELLQ